MLTAQVTANINIFSTDDLKEAKKSLVSTLNKCEKCLLKLSIGTSQYTLLTRRIKALRISLILIEKQLLIQQN